MKTKFVFTSSFKPDFTIKYKARLVVCGYSQIYGIDYTETFAPTTPILNVTIMAHIGKVMNSYISSFDVKGAFLEGNNDHVQYCYLPEQLFGPNYRVRIVKSLYGQKQSPKIWNDHLNNILIRMGFTRCPVSPCLYSYINGKDYLFITIHVDDGYMISSNKDIVDSFQNMFKTYIKEFTIYHPVMKYLGIEFEEDKNYVYLHQQHYIKNINLLDINNDYKNEKIPMKPTVNLRIHEQNTLLEPLLPVCGALRYLSDRTRPDILTATGEVSSNGSPHPTNEHVKVAKNILRYVKSTYDTKLVLGGQGPIILFAYSDAAFITSGKCKSRLGGCLFLGEDAGSIYSFSRNDHTVSHSSCEAEIKAIDLTIKSILHVRDLLQFFGHEQFNKTILYTDSKSSIDLLNTLKSKENTRHINVRINYIREAINLGNITLKFIENDNNVADGLTKPLDVKKFSKFKSKLLNFDE
jgi:hypothetical protein